MNSPIRTPGSSRALRVDFGSLLLIAYLRMPAFGSEPIIGATFGPISVNEATVGDIWSSTWAGNGAIYAVQDDSMFPDGSTANLAISRLDGDDPQHLTYTLINKMQEYGKAGAAFGIEKGTWKAAGIISADNALYVSVNRVLFSSIDRKRRRIETVDASIIKSTDGGMTWTRTSEENLKRPMFPSNRFSNPVFIQYGKNASVSAHGSDCYIYAVSSNGPWSHADYLILGRVLRGKIGHLNGADWEFYRGGGRDGMRDNQWTHDASRATPILSDPDNLGWTNVTYLPQLGRYLMGQWHWLTGRWHEGDCTWVLREAPTPWGPWTTVATRVWDMYHDYYFPVLAPKFISDDGLHIHVFTAGWGKYTSILYRLSVMPITLVTRRSLSFSKDHLEFGDTLGQTRPADQSIEVHLGDGRPVTGLSVESAPSWITTSIEPSASRTRVINHVSDADLSPGEYSGQVILVSPGAEPARAWYTVSVKIQQLHHGLTVGKTKPGVRYQYYASPRMDFGGVTQLAKFSKLRIAPEKTGVCALPDLRCLPNPAKFFVHFEGYFQAVYPGEYTFFLNSQDGSRLIVSEQMVVDNDGPHAPYERAGTLWLEEGLHPFAVDFFQAYGNGHLQLDVRVPGQSRRPLDAADLVHVGP
jgi:hypothetical protein